MKTKKTLMLSFALSVFIAACAAGGSYTSEEIGLRKTALESENINFSDIKFANPEAGTSQLIERSFENAPPLISHTTEGMLPITKDMNSCLTCHDKAIAKDVGAISAPESHYFDLRLGKSTGDTISEARFVCSLCHVEQSNAQPLVANTFKPAFKDETLKTKSNLLDVLNEGVK